MNISKIGNTSSARVETFRPPTIDQPLQGRKGQGSTSPSGQNTEVLNSAEKDYFAGAFPSASATLRTHQVYTPAGKSATPPSPGGLIDRKG